MRPFDLSHAALQTFLQSLTGQEGGLALEAPVERPTHQSLLDTSAQMVLLQGTSDALTVAVWLHPGWLALCGQAMLGEALKPRDEGADDLLREVSAQAFGSVRAQLGGAGLKLPDLQFNVLSNPRELNLPETTTLVRFEMPHGEETLDGLALIASTLAVPEEPKAAEAPRGSAAAARPAPSLPVAPAQFADIGGEQMGDGRGGNMDLLVDVELEVVVELGRRRLPLADVMRLSAGSVIELEKLMGEPLEVYANGKLIAEGEAVVIDEQFGIRITSIAAKRRREKVFL